MTNQDHQIFSALYYLPFYFMSVRGVSPTRSGINLFPAVFFLLPGSIVVAALTTRLGRFRWAIWAGWATTTVGAGLWILLDLHTKTVVWAVGLAVFGVGSGMVLTSVNVGIQAISTTEDAAMAASMYGFMRSLGMPIGVAVSLSFPYLILYILISNSSLAPSFKIQCHPNSSLSVFPRVSHMTRSAMSSSCATCPPQIPHVCLFWSHIHGASVVCGYSRLASVPVRWWPVY